ncbi:MAG: Spy/CpxP family protein refolding chaperone [Lentisphaerae bacterium]|nr:Spy/CpxP family protein refolding chaperone [Lentisphaerota bacterium]
MQTKRKLIWITALSMLLSGAAFSLGMGNTESTDYDASAGQGQRPHKGRGGQLMAELEKLDLTADQSQQIASIVKLNRETMKEVHSAWAEARAALERQISADEFDETAVRTACRNAAAAGEEFAVQRAKIASQIRAVLTSDQRAELDKIRAEKRSTKGKRFGKEHGAPVGE